MTSQFNGSEPEEIHDLLGDSTMRARYCMFLAIALLVGGSSSAEDGKKVDKDRLDGEWTLASMELRGKVMGEEQRKDWKLVVKDNGWLQSSKSDPGKEMKMTFKTDPSKSPKQIDFKWEGPG